jgi:hypothetical protein
MGLNVFTIDFRSLGKEKTFRYDVDFSDFQNSFSMNKYCSFDDIFAFDKANPVNIELEPI